MTGAYPFFDMNSIPFPLDLPALHARLLASAPLVQAITNTVVQQFSANVLLAAGAAPAMIDHEADAAQFAGVADGILINLGTASNHQLLAADAAISVAGETGKPWVLDPVSVGVVAFRTLKIRQAAAARPTVVRGNASEIAALAGAGAGGRGVDSTDEVDAVLPAAIRLAQATGGVVAVSGARDAVVAVDGAQVRIARIGGGHALMPKVVGMGCSLGSLVVAYLAAGRALGGERRAGDWAATVAAHAHFALAGAAAGAQAAGPGSFQVAFVDALHALRASDLARADVQVETLTI